MLKSLRVPERLFQLAGWAVSLALASFLIGLGGKIVADLPGVDQRISIEQFLDPSAVARLTSERESLTRRQRDERAARDRAQLPLDAASNAYRAARDGFDNWIATRTATTDPRQDPEVLRRTRELDALKAGERLAQAEVERLDAVLLRTSQGLDTNREARAAIEQAARHTYDRAVFRQELRVFAIRLALTLPLLLVAWWLLLHKRKSPYWPLARGFVMFAVFAFFVELVPYLPSYGGYVRYAVGAAGTALAGVYLIRAMQRYVARRAAVEQQTEPERRRSLDYEAAIKKMSAGVCPGCERAIPAGTPDAPSNFCGHCGITLFDHCRECSARKNAFFHHCPVCGTQGLGTRDEG